MQPNATCSLAHFAASLRGLLAEPSGDPDRPWRPVILNALDSPQALAYAAQPALADNLLCPVPVELDHPPLWLPEPLAAADSQADESLREALVQAIQDYVSHHGAKPTLFCLPGLGLIQLTEPARTQAQGPPLTNQVALVTGAAGAIGRGICRGLLEQGACVAAIDLSTPSLEQMVSEFGGESAGGEWAKRLIGVTVDVTRQDSMANGLARVARQWGGIDIIVINAGIAHVAALTELELETFQKLERVNVEGTLLTLAEGARLLKRQGTGGDIVLVSTKNVFAPGARFGAYSATKAASHQLARIASLELAEFDIRVNMVAPDGVFSDDGQTRSGLWATVGPDRMKARGLDEKGLEEYYRNRNLLKARITARHVANAVLFFVTRQTPTTGATIPIDGGLPDATPR